MIVSGMKKSGVNKNRTIVMISKIVMPIFDSLLTNVMATLLQCGQCTKLDSVRFFNSAWVTSGPVAIMDMG